MDSTFGYDAFAKGVRTAAISMRQRLLGLYGGNFGWPLDLPPNGPFWTNEINEYEIRRVLDFIVSADEKEWAAQVEKYARQMMVYDPGNRLFIDLLRHLGIKWTP